MSVRKKVRFDDEDSIPAQRERTEDEDWEEGEQDEEFEDEDEDESDVGDEEEGDGEDCEKDDPREGKEEEEVPSIPSEDASKKANQQLSDEDIFQNPEEINEPDEEKEGKKVRVKRFKSSKNHSKRLIVILEKANLEIIKIGKTFQLLNCDDHMSFIRKYKKDPAFCRPDITHQCLLMLFDSPLNRAGLLQVYIHTMNNILIEINPQTRFPRTFKRFANLMVQLLYRLYIKSAQGGGKLLRVIKNPVTAHLPVGCRKIGTSFKSDKLIHPQELIPDPESDEPVVVVIGAMAHGEATVDYTEETVSLSNYPLSGALACTRVVSAFESAWGVL